MPGQHWAAVIRSPSRTGCHCPSGGRESSAILNPGPCGVPVIIYRCSKESIPVHWEKSVLQYTSSYHRELQAIMLTVEHNIVTSSISILLHNSYFILYKY